MMSCPARWRCIDRRWAAATSGALAGALLACVPSPTTAARLTLQLTGVDDVVLVGALRRWDEEGNARAPVDPKARIEAPRVDVRAEQMSPGKWVFSKLPPGRYDLVVITRARLRVEGFCFPPVDEFDEFLSGAAGAPADAAEAVQQLIREARHYENKVTPLFLAGNDRQVRVLVQLLRDEATSFDAEFGQPVATLRHEVWQFNERSGGWAKHRRTKVLDRILAPRAELCQWTWLWEPRLGGIAVDEMDLELAYHYSASGGDSTARGLAPD